MHSLPRKDAHSQMHSPAQRAASRADGQPASRPRKTRRKTSAPLPVSLKGMALPELVKRFAVMFVGFFCIAMGVALLTKSNTGTSAISVIPYTASLLLPWPSYGTWVGLFNGMLVLAQLVLLRGKCQPVDIAVQFVFCVSFGAFVDVCMWILGAYDPQAYPLRLLTLFAGVVMLALGATITLCSRVGVGAGDGFARAICQLTSIDFGLSRIVCDSTWMLIAVVLNLAFFQGLVTVREGTLATALFAGVFVNIFLKAIKPLELAIIPENRPAQP